MVPQAGSGAIGAIHLPSIPGHLMSSPVPARPPAHLLVPPRHPPAVRVNHQHPVTQPRQEPRAPLRTAGLARPQAPELGLWPDLALVSIDGRVGVLRASYCIVY